jgi:hypothetical protein
MDIIALQPYAVINQAHLLMQDCNHSSILLPKKDISYVYPSKKSLS